MDSISPIAAGTAGQTTTDSGTFGLLFAMVDTFKPMEFPRDWLASLGLARGPEQAQTSHHPLATGHGHRR